MSHPLTEQDKVTEKLKAAVNNLLPWADGFQMIMSKRGYARGVCEALAIIAAGRIHIHIMQGIVGCWWQKMQNDDDD